MIKKILLIFVLLGQVSSLFAMGVGSSGGQFLTVVPGARPFSMGELQAVLAEDLNSLYGNPAGLAKSGRMQVAATHVRSFSDTSLSWAGIIFPIYISKLPRTFGISVQYFDGGTIEVDDGGEFTTSLKAEQSFLLSTSLATRIGTTSWLQDFYVGITVKGMYTRLVEEYRAYSAAADIGMFYHIPNLGLRVAVTLLNIGPPLKFIAEDNPLPLRARAGIGYYMPFGSQQYALIGVEVESLIEQVEKIKWHFGGEMWISKFLALRTGYKTQTDFGPFSVGIGIKVSDLQVDYGIAFLGNIPPTHRLSLMGYLGPIVGGRIVGSQRVVLASDSNTPSWITAPTIEYTSDEVFSRGIIKKARVPEEARKDAITIARAPIEELFPKKVVHDLAVFTRNWKLEHKVQDEFKKEVVGEIFKRLPPMSKWKLRIYPYYELIEEVKSEEGDVLTFYNYYVRVGLELDEYRIVRRQVFKDKYAQIKKKAAETGDALDMLYESEMKSLIKNESKSVGHREVLERIVREIEVNPKTKEVVIDERTGLPRMQEERLDATRIKPIWVYEGIGVKEDPYEVADKVWWITNIGKSETIAGAIADAQKSLVRTLTEFFEERSKKEVEDKLKKSKERPLSPERVDELKEKIRDYTMKALGFEAMKLPPNDIYSEKIEETLDVDGGFVAYYSAFVRYKFRLQTYRKARKHVLEEIAQQALMRGDTVLHSQVMTLLINFKELVPGDTVIRASSHETKPTWVVKEKEFRIDGDSIICKGSTERLMVKKMDIKDPKEAVDVALSKAREILKTQLKDKINNSIEELSRGSKYAIKKIESEAIINSTIANLGLFNIEKAEPTENYYERVEEIVDNAGNTREFYNAYSYFKIDGYKREFRKALKNFAENARQNNKLELAEHIEYMLKNLR